jgi:ABC-type sulfate/molybdate transport systems ATPase subunit
VLLLDEPFSALDAELRERLADEVAELLRTPAMAWRSWAVSRAVNNARHEGPDLLRPVA